MIMKIIKLIKVNKLEYKIIENKNLSGLSEAVAFADTAT